MVTTLLRVTWLGLLVGACAGASGGSAAAPTTVRTTVEVVPATPAAEPAAAPADSTPAPAEIEGSSPVSTTTMLETRLGVAPPAWLGTRPLELRPGEDNAIAQPTPAEMVDRQFWTIDVLAPPHDDLFVSTVTSPPPADVLSRSTFKDDCPVPSADLAYAQVAFFGFDGEFHTGEFIARTGHVDGLVTVFEALHEMRFPIEQMVVTTQEAVDAHPTGDSNNTSSFVCRQAVNSGSWSRHALGGAIDINPFHNPYVKGDLVIPELAGAYLDRDHQRIGMVTPEVVELFAEMGWSWGGNWRSAKDWMHFSDTGG